MAAAVTMLSMTLPTTSSKLLLILDPRAAGEQGSGSRARRYRIARLRFDAGAQSAGERFPQLGRVYD